MEVVRYLLINAVMLVWLGSRETLLAVSSQNQDDEVTGLSVVQVNYSSVNITWTPLGGSNGTLFYEIYYNTAPELVHNETIRANATKPSFVIVSNLKYNHTYNFSIAAVILANNTVTRGPLSKTVQFSFIGQNVLPFLKISKNASVLTKVLHDTMYFKFPEPYRFNKEIYTSGCISNHGVIIFNELTGAAEPRLFPINEPVIAPYWEYISLWHDGGVYVDLYNAENGSEVLTRISTFINSDQTRNKSFTPTSVVVIEWRDTCPFRIPLLPCSSTNTFQAVLVSSGDTSYAVFTYKCGSLNWINRNASIGYSAGEDFFYNYELSRTHDVNDIACLNEPYSPWSNLVFKLADETFIGLSVTQINHSSVNITWSPLIADVVFYEINYTVHGLSDSNKAISVNASESSFAVLTNLSHLFYEFSIAAVTLANGTKVRGPPLDIVDFFLIIDDNVLPFLEISDSASVLTGMEYGSMHFWFPEPFYFNEEIFINGYVYSDGLISLRKKHLFALHPQLFPISQYVIIAPYWDLMDIQMKGSVYVDLYDAENGSQVLTTISTFINANRTLCKPFKPTSAVVIRWNDVCPFHFEESNCSLTNSFQAVLASSGDTSYAIFTYHCGSLNWVNYNASIGYGAGEDFFFNHNLSRTKDVNDIACLNEPYSPWSNLVFNLANGSVKGLSLTQTSYSSVNITWTPLSSDDIVFYEIYYIAISSDVNINKTIRVNVTESNSVVLKNLNLNLKYNFSIAAILSVNETNIRLPYLNTEQFSFSIDSMTVRNLSIVHQDITSITLKWNPDDGLLQETSIPIIFEIRILSNDFQTSELTWMVSSTVFELNNLAPSTSYNFSVTPVSHISSGLPQLVNGQTKAFNQSVTGILLMQTSSSSVNLSWTPLASNDVIFYEVYYTAANSLEINETVQVNATELSVVISGLRNYLNYTFSMRAVVLGNGKEIRGPLSLMVHSFIYNSITVENLQTIHEDITSVVLNWSPHSSIPPDLLTYFTYNISWSNSKLTNVKKSSKLEIRDLLPHTCYKFTVTPVSLFTFGIPQVVNGSTRELEQITKPSVTQIDHSSVKVNWTSLDSNDVVFYEIHYMAMNSTGINVTEKSIANATESPPVIITDLSYNLTYYFSIAAVVIGNGTNITGPLSDVVEFSFPYNETTPTKGYAASLELILITVFSTGGVFFILILVTGLILCLFCAFRQLHGCPKQSASAVNHICMDMEEKNSPTLVETEIKEEHLKANPEILGLQDVLIDKNNIQLTEKIGQGHFGIVYRGLLTKHNDAIPTPVAVKTLNGSFTQRDIDSFIEECLKMKLFDHINVLSLIGICTDLKKAPCVVMPLMDEGSLLSYLRKERPNLTVCDMTDENAIFETTKQLMSMCLQVSKGMMYLIQQKFIHRDLAARNCMVSSNGIIKVADFGLAEDIYEKQYFRVKGEDASQSVMLPVKWMAIESIHDGVFSEKTDIWSFGVLCWEVFAVGRSPYPGLTHREVIHMIDSGERLDKPSNSACNEEIYSLMLSCWNQVPEERPSFSQTVELLENMMAPLANYMDFTEFHNQK